MTGAPAPLRVDRVSFVVPAKDEEGRLGGSLRRLIDFVEVQPYASQIIVVDDGSTDRTAQVAQQAAAELPARVSFALIRHERNRGKGAAVRTGVRAADGDVVLYLDADLSTPPEETPKLLGLLSAGADVAIGTRLGPGGKDQRASQPVWRRLGGRAFAAARRRLLLPDIQDTQCGFKAFRRQAARQVFERQRLEGWAFDGELLYIARKLGLNIAQVPVDWHHEGGSRFRLSPKMALRELFDVLRIRSLHRGT